MGRTWNMMPMSLPHEPGSAASAPSVVRASSWDRWNARVHRRMKPSPATEEAHFEPRFLSTERPSHYLSSIAIFSIFYI